MFPITSSRAYQVQGTVNNCAVKFLVDTGAAVTVVTRALWNQCTTAPALRKLADKQLLGVDGTPLKVEGWTEADITIGPEAFRHAVVVVEDLAADGILGLDFLEDNSCVIDTNSRLLLFNHRSSSVPLVSPQTQGTPAVRDVTVGHTIVVPARSELEIIAIAPVEGDGTWLLQGSPKGVVPVLVARCLVSPIGGSVPVRIVNPGVEAVTVRTGTVIGNIELLQDIEISAIKDANSPPDRSTSKELEQLLWDATQKTDLPLSQQRQLFYVLEEHANIFARNKNDLGRTGRAKHKIDTQMAHPIRQRVRRLPPARRDAANTQIQDMLEHRVIQPSESSWAAPVVLVKKKDGSFRFCIDYRKLNEVTVKDAYPLPRIDDTLDTLNGCKWFSTLDLISGYWQVEIAAEDKHKTAFCTPGGLYEFNVMPFGLCNAPATFQRLMNTILTGAQWESCLVYLDDIVIIGCTFEEHLHNLKRVLSCLKEAGLKLQPNKCHFCRKKVSFLGHTVSEKGIATDESKTTTVKEWPVPTCPKDVQRFLGLVNYYRRFIKDFAHIARPLTRLTEKSSGFHWTKDCQVAFEMLKSALVSTPILAFPNFARPFLIDTDASDRGIGAVLSQSSR